ncbi:MAG: 7-carboxy-7-deazaguanine synthase QueE [Candidatus Eisenbacteria bacterium]
MNTQTVNLSEIFASVEGEGVNLGRPAVFVRLAGCNLACSFCDTGYAREESDFASVHVSGDTTLVPNPVDCETVLSVITTGFPDERTVVLTGGEPLVQVDAVRHLARRLRLRGYTVHLETNGTLGGALEGIRDLIDFVCMDIKLPSSQQGVNHKREHRIFLEMLGHTDCAVKIVVTPEATASEFEEAVGLIEDVNPHLPVLIQPAFTDSRPAVGARKILDFREAAASRLRDVRISIQLHKILGVR